MKNYSLVLSNDGRNTMLIDLNARDGMTTEDVFGAIKAASMEYCKTEEGRRFYEGNYKVFDYWDFATYVPNEICEKYGIEKIEKSDRIVVNDLDMGEELVDEDDFENDLEAQEKEL